MMTTKKFIMKVMKSWQKIKTTNNKNKERNKLMKIQKF